tara:strand:- start:14 stop:628 length:615 start_codon:yes stop_codon:yes gene_type:complete
MWYYNGQIIKTPKAMTIGDITHPAGIFTDSSTLTSLGIKPYTEVRPDNRYYNTGSYSVDTSGDEVVGTYAENVKDLAMLRSILLSNMNDRVQALLTEIDWYWSRAAKGNDAVPSAIATYATTIYSEKDTKETEIGNLNTIAKIKEYEARAYTETRKDEVFNDDGTFKEYHASNTTDFARTINMTTHFTVHPNRIDAGQVSLTAD